MNRLLITMAFLLLPMWASAACKYLWMDHDYNTSTPPIQKQVCDSVIDIPAIPSPTIQPIQQPQIRPLPPLGIPPIGTTQCRTESIYENGQWVTKQVCH